jgi:hypothetical protein
MPYHLAREGDKYFVVGEDKKRHSKEGMSKEMARKQMVALNMAHSRKMGEAIPRLKGSIDKFRSVQQASLAKQIRIGEFPSVKEMIDTAKANRKAYIKNNY